MSSNAPENDVTMALAKSLKTIMSDRKIEHVSVDEICRNANVSRRSFYNYFQDKYELLEWTYHQIFGQIIPHKPEFTMIDYYPYLFKDFYENRGFFLNAFDADGQNSFRKYSLSRLRPIVMHDFADLFPNEDVADFIVEHFLMLSFDALVKWLREDKTRNDVEYINDVKSLMADLSDRLSKISHAEPAEPERWE